MTDADTSPQPRRRSSAGPARTDAILAAAGALPPVPSTLRVPLAARAFGDALFPRMAVEDGRARALMDALGDNGARWLHDRFTVFAILARTRRIRELAKGYLATHPDGHIVNLGCGLSDYFQWLDNGQARLTEADLAPVLALRRQLLPLEGERRHLLEVDATADDWWEALKLPDRRHEPKAGPIFLLTEGLLMYLKPEQVAAILARFGACAPLGSTFTFDAMCWLASGQAWQHPSIGPTRAEFHWGPRHLSDLTDPSPDLSLDSVASLLEPYGLPYSLVDPGFRLMFGVPIYAVYQVQARGPEH